MGPLPRLLRRLAHASDTAIILVHHMSRSGHFRGSTAIRDAVDREWAFRQSDESDSNIELQNRFYLGQLPEGHGGWIEGAHEPLLDDGLFEAAQKARSRRVTNSLPVKNRAPVYSLSGLLRRHHCGGTLHIYQSKDRARVYCYRGRQGPKCTQRSTLRDVYEAQVLEYFEGFTLPADLQEALVGVQARSHDGIADVAARRHRLERRRETVRTTFERDDLSKDEYIRRREAIVRQIGSLHDTGAWEGILAKAARFLGDLPAAWRAANDAQKNALARVHLVQIRINDTWVTAVEPRPSLAPFFSWDCQVRRLSGGSDGIRTRGLSLDRAAC